MREGIRVSLPGKSVKSTDTKDIAFDSANTPLSVLLGQDPTHSGTFDTVLADVTPSANSFVDVLLKTIPHGLGYVPATQAFAYVAAVPDAINFLTGTSYYQVPLQLNSATQTTHELYYVVDSKEMRFYFRGVDLTALGVSRFSITGMELQVKYYIFVNHAT